MFADSRLGLTLKQFTTLDEKEDDGGSRRCVGLKFEIDPFSPEQAAALNIKSRLFDSQGEPHPDMLAGTLSFRTNGLQRVTFYAAPDVEMPISLVLPSVKVTPTIKVTQVDEPRPHFVATLTLVTDGTPDAKDLPYLILGVGSMHFLTFEDELPDLFEDDEQSEARTPALRHRKGTRENPIIVPVGVVQ